MNIKHHNSSRPHTYPTPNEKEFPEERISSFSWNALFCTNAFSASEDTRCESTEWKISSQISVFLLVKCSTVCPPHVVLLMFPGTLTGNPCLAPPSCPPQFDALT
ncbi:uncharacterized protein ACO6RY_19441 [Pungitius sinensis]